MADELRKSAGSKRFGLASVVLGLVANVGACLDASTMTSLGDIQALRDDLQRRVAEVLHAAESAANPSARWSEVQSAWTGSATFELATNGRAARGDCVREVLVALTRAYEVHVRGLDRSGLPTEVSDALWTLRHRTLAGLVDESLTRYFARVAPPRSVASIFANATQAKPVPTPSTARIGKSVETVACRGCGAPRLGTPTTNVCGFCGTPFFAPDTL